VDKTCFMHPQEPAIYRETAAPLHPVYSPIATYYEIAGPDYETWSPHFNMHFGYCRRFRDIFSLEGMLLQMNAKVLEELQLDPKQPALVADLGCGMATVARYAAVHYPLSHLVAVTIVKKHVEMARELNQAAGLQNRITVCHDNFEDLHLSGESITHAYAIESACHAASAGKQKFIAEMARILKPGGRFCIADGFLKTEKPPTGIFKWLYQKMTGYWAVPGFAGIDTFRRELEKAGLVNIKVKEISYRIAPSVAYIPLVCLKFFIRELLKNKTLRMKRERWHNVYAPLLGMLVGLFRNQFGYFMITGEKPKIKIAESSAGKV